METKIITKNGISCAVVKSSEVIITDAPSAIDFMMTVHYETNCRRIALNKQVVIEDFFILSSGIAGEILQKFITYEFKFAVIGDFSRYTSKPLKDFIYESNRGNDIFFVASVDEAVEKLLR